MSKSLGFVGTSFAEVVVSEEPPRRSPLVRRHLLFGWWSLLCFLTVGITLEALHAFKIGWYLEEAYQTRRFLWTLGHAHGTLLSLVHIAFAWTCSNLAAPTLGRFRYSSPLLMGASVLLPGGFLLGGLFLYGGDPGIGVWLVPVGALFFLLAVFFTASRIASEPTPEATQPEPAQSAPPDNESPT